MRDTLEMIYNSFAEQRERLLKAQSALSRTTELAVRCEEKLNALEKLDKFEGKSQEIASCVLATLR